MYSDPQPLRTSNFTVHGITCWWHLVAKTEQWAPWCWHLVATVWKQAVAYYCIAFLLLISLVTQCPRESACEALVPLYFPLALLGNIFLFCRKEAPGPVTRLAFPNICWAQFVSLFVRRSCIYMSCKSNGLFTFSDSNSDWDSYLDSKHDGYIALCRSFHIGSDPDLDPYSDGFLNGYCTHFMGRSPSQGQISVPILLYFNQGIRVWIQTNGEFLYSTVIRVRQCK